MTNGEKLIEVFPSIELYKKTHDGILINFNSTWWNAEYKEPTTKNEAKYCDRNICLKNEYNNVGCEDCEVAKSQESTTKNCESCRYYGLHHEVCNYCYKCSLWTEGEPTTKNDLAVDCVSITEVRKAIIEHQYSNNFCEEHNIDHSINTSMALLALSDLPQVTPIKPKGHWIKKNDDYHDWYECSECGYGSEGEMQYSSEQDVRTNYCPHCGADMREAEE